MAEQAGPAMAAIRAKQAALADRHRTLAEADQLLAGVLQEAHASAVTARRRIDSIAAEIGAGVQQAGFAVDTPLGAREFQRYLLARQRELIAIVADGQQDATAKRVLLESLSARYARSTG